MTPAVSVITPLYQPHEEFLLEAYASLCQQQVNWEWLLQWDGAGGNLPAPIMQDRRVRVADNGKWMGTGASRNRALAYAKGQFVYPLDYDDLLAPDAFVAMLKVFQDHPQVGWVAGVFDDLILVDGEWVKTPFLTTRKPGIIPKGADFETRELRRKAQAENSPEAEALPSAIHPSAILARSDLVYAVGGWGHGSRGEDSMLFWSLQEIADGYYTDAQTGWYRKHPSQITKEGQTQEAADMTKLYRKRVQAIRELGLGCKALKG